MLSINDPPRVSVTVCQQIITYVVTFIPNMCKKQEITHFRFLNGSIQEANQNCRLTVKIVCNQ